MSHGISDIGGFLVGSSMYVKRYLIFILRVPFLLIATEIAPSPMLDVPWMRSIAVLTFLLSELKDVEVVDAGICVSRYIYSVFILGVKWLVINRC